MLGKIRTFSNSTGAKFLLGGIILIFMSFGLSGLRTPKDTIVSIDGKDAVSVSDLVKAKKHLSHLYQSEIPDSELTRIALTRLVGEKLMGLELERLGIIISDDVIIDHIKHDKMFQDKSGKFDKDLFKRILRSNNIRESDYVAKLKYSIGSSVFMDQLKISNIPEQILRQFYQYKYQQREVELFTIANSFDPIRVSEEELKTYYEVNKARFYKPELRKLEYIVITPNSFRSSVNISNSEVESELAELNPSSGKERQELKKKIIENKLDQKMFEKMKLIEDAAASGESIKEISKKFNLKYIEAPHVNSKGIAVNNGVASSPVPISLKFLEEAFLLEEGMVSEIIKSDTENEYYMVSVNNIRHKQLQTLDEVKKAITDEITLQKTYELNRKAASDIKDNLLNNKKIDEKYKNKLDVKRMKFKRFIGEEEASINPRLHDAIFSLKTLGDYTDVIDVDHGELVFAKLLSISNPNNPSREELNGVSQESNQFINQTLHQSLSSSFGNRYKVEIFQENIPRKS
ncbi:MAG: SurA N-terminal domain-containing protein [Alphaproteobacteria bacterium]|nr:SurA N-terminal domain-containing protein [Alphaproteobacteria bacterium]